MNFFKYCVSKNILFLYSSLYLRPRDEASSATIGNMTYVIGGVGEKSVEFINMGGTSDDFASGIVNRQAAIDSRRSNDKKPRQNQPVPLPKWQIGTPLPSVRARSCAVATDNNTIYVLGKIASHSSTRS